jgi:hypothetical protein
MVGSMARINAKSTSSWVYFKVLGNDTRLFYISIHRHLALIPLPLSCIVVKEYDDLTLAVYHARR